MISKSISFMTQNPEIVSLTFAEVNHAPTTIIFKSDTSDERRAAIQSDADNFDWTPAPIPDPVSFKRAILTNEGLPIAAKAQLMQYLGLVDGYAADPESTKLAWAQLKQYLNLDPNLIAVLEQTAAGFGMPLQ